MSVYRGGAFLWCAPITSLHGLALDMLSMVGATCGASMRLGAPCLSTATAPSCGARRGRSTHVLSVCMACLQGLTYIDPPQVNVQVD